MTLANLDRQFSAGGKTYTLRGSAKCWRALMDYFDVRSFDEAGQRLDALLGEKQLGVDEMVALTHATLQSHHPDVSRDDTLDLMDEHGMRQVFEAAMEAIMAGAVQAESHAESGEGSAAPRPRKAARKRGRSRTT